MQNEYHLNTYHRVMYYHHCLIAIIGAAAVNKTKESTTCSPLIVTNQVMTLLALHNVCVST